MGVVKSEAPPPEATLEAPKPLREHPLPPPHYRPDEARDSVPTETQPFGGG